MSPKIDGYTPDLAGENIAALKQIFPEAFSEDKVDFDKLKQLLGEYADDSSERYNFTWNGKGKALRLSQISSRGTLRPCPDESKNWESTENLYIEGDNLEVLKLLQKSYHSKVKMIYIDPPYNTGNDFVYPDDFSDSLKHYKEVTGQVDSEGRRVSTNSESSGRFHTDWLNMIYPRLRLARNLLRDDGVIFISIDDNEVANLRKVCDEIFGEDNFLANIVWQKKYAATNDAKGISVTHDHILLYQKNSLFNRNLLPRTDEQNEPYKHNDNDGKGLWRADNILVKSFSENCVYPIKNPNTNEIYYPPKGSCWRASEDTMNNWLSEGRIFFGKDGKGAPQLKRYLNEVQQGRVPITWWSFEEAGHNDAANKELKMLFESKSPFDTPKPTKLIKQMLLISVDKSDLILDFFSGSSSTAHAVMQLNAEDGGNRKFIMVQLQELCAEDSEAYKAGYKNICEIGKERIRRAGAEIKSDLIEEYKGQKTLDGSSTVMNPEKLDIGFKVFKLDNSNIIEWNPDHQNIDKTIAESLNNLVPDRSELDLVYELLLKEGYPLTEKIEKKSVDGKDIYSADEGNLLICLDNNITAKIVQKMAEMKPSDTEKWHVIFRDNGFASDSDKINAREILKSSGLKEDAFLTL